MSDGSKQQLPKQLNASIVKDMTNRTILFQPKPWLDLLPRSSNNAFLKTHHQQSSSVEADSDQIHVKPVSELFSLPCEVIHHILSMLEAEQFSILAQVSTQFFPYVYDPRHWRRIALKLWPAETQQELEKRLYQYKSWRKLCTLRPRLRTHGIYILRYQFSKTSTRLATEEPEAPVFMVTYYRFLRFYSDGTVISLTSPDFPHLAYRRVRRVWWPGPGERDKTPPTIGRYSFDEKNLQVNLTLPMNNSRFPQMRSGTIYMQLNLSSTKPGAFDRLNPTSHYTIMDDDGGELVPYQVDSRPFRLVPIWGFRTGIYKMFPRDDDRDLAQWFEMKKAARTFQRHATRPLP